MPSQGSGAANIDRRKKALSILSMEKARRETRPKKKLQRMKIVVRTRVSSLVVVAFLTQAQKPCKKVCAIYVPI